MPRRKKLFFKIELVSLIFPNKYWISAASSTSFSSFYVYPFCPNPLFFLVLAIWGFCKRSLAAFLESFQVQKWKQPQGWSAVRAASGWVEPRGCACGKKAHKWRRPRNEDTNPQYTHTHTLTTLIYNITKEKIDHSPEGSPPGRRRLRRENSQQTLPTYYLRWKTYMYELHNTLEDPCIIPF